MLSEVIECLSKKEIFIDVVDYENLYQISNCGRVLGVKNGYILRPKICKTGYQMVTLSKNSKLKYFLVHRLVLFHFDRAPKQGEECRHKDGNKLNNNILNLEWGTHKENIKDRTKHGKAAIGVKNGMAKLTEEQVKDIRQMYKTGRYTHRDLSTLFNINRKGIYQILNNFIWKHI